MPDERPQLSPEQTQALGEELDALRKRVMDDLGEPDVAYIRNLIKAQRALEISGRGLLFASFLPPAWLAGVAALSLSKILDNMEIGHNVMHGQYDWTGDPTLSSSKFEWDTACPADQWRHSHNYIHHTYTNILGKDRDIGYGVTADERAGTVDAAMARQPALRTRAGGVLPVRRRAARPRDRDARQAPGTAPAARAAGRHLEEGARPDAEGLRAVPAALGAAGAARLRPATRPRTWRATCGPSRSSSAGTSPRGPSSSRRTRPAQETRGEWYVRQMLGSANLTGGPLFHILSGNLSHQIEHHLFPDIPARRYAEHRDGGQGDLRALRAALQRRPAATPARLGVSQDRAARATRIGRLLPGALAGGERPGG